MLRKTLATTFLISALMGFSLFIIHIQIKTTLLGYKIGKLQDEKTLLVKEISLLNMQLSKKTDKKKRLGGHVAPHGGRAAPLAAGARLIAAPTRRRRHLTQRGASRRRRQNRRELAARPRQQKHQRLLNFSFSSRLVSSCRRRTRARRALVSPRSLREGRFEPGASRRGGGARRQNARRSTH